MTKSISKVQDDAVYWPLLLFFGSLAIFFSVSAVFWTIIPFFQMTTYLGLTHSGKANRVLQSDFIFSPYTYSQRLIRYEFLKQMEDQPLNERTLPNLDKAIAKMEELIEIEGTNPYQHIRVARAFDKKADFLNDAVYYKQAEKYYKQAIALSPTRQELHYAYGLSLVRQKRFDEAIHILNHYPVLDPDIPISYFYLGLAQFNKGKEAYADALYNFEFYFGKSSEAPDPAVSKNIYEKLLSHFYEIKDPVRFPVVSYRLSFLDPKQQGSYLHIVEFIKKNNRFPSMVFRENKLVEASE